MNDEQPLIAMALKMRQKVPYWHSLVPLRGFPGLELTVHFETWWKAIALCEEDVNPRDFQVALKEVGWVSVTFPFTAGTADTIGSLQKTIAVLLNAIDHVEKHTRSDQFQLVACGILRSVNELKGYLLEAYISYEMKDFLRKANKAEIEKLATNAMKKAARFLNVPQVQKYAIAFVQDGGFLFLDIGDGSGSFLGADFRDRERPDDPVGYCMNSDNIDSPAVQLILLYALATITAWGKKQ